MQKTGRILPKLMKVILLVIWHLMETARWKNPFISSGSSSLICSPEISDELNNVIPQNRGCGYAERQKKTGRQIERSILEFCIIFTLLLDIASPPLYAYTFYGMTAQKSKGSNMNLNLTGFINAFSCLCHISYNIAFISAVRPKICNCPTCQLGFQGSQAGSGRAEIPRQ